VRVHFVCACQRVCVCVRVRVNVLCVGGGGWGGGGGWYGSTVNGFALFDFFLMGCGGAFLWGV